MVDEMLGTARWTTASRMRVVQILPKMRIRGSLAEMEKGLFFLPALLFYFKENL